jgi:serine/threonine protein kinase
MSFSARRTAPHRTAPPPPPPPPPPPYPTPPQVADFNLSKVMEGSLVSTVGGANNPRWLAPEVLNGTPATFASDVFAFGVVMWEVLTWDIPWQTEQAFLVGGCDV